MNAFGWLGLAFLLGAALRLMWVVLFDDDTCTAGTTGRRRKERCTSFCTHWGLVTYSNPDLAYHYLEYCNICQHNPLVPTLKQLMYDLAVASQDRWWKEKERQVRERRQQL